MLVRDQTKSGDATVEVEKESVCGKNEAQRYEHIPSVRARVDICSALSKLRLHPIEFSLKDTSACLGVVSGGSTSFLNSTLSVRALQLTE